LQCYGITVAAITGKRSKKMDNGSGIMLLNLPGLAVGRWARFVACYCCFSVDDIVDWPPWNEVGNYRQKNPPQTL